MTSVVQTVPANGLAGVASKTVTIAATGSGNAIIILIAVEAGSTGYTGFTITDSKSNTGYASAVLLVGGARTVAIYYLLSPAQSGVTTVTIAGTGGSGGMFGALAVQEVSGLTAVDKTNTGTAPSTSPMTLNNSAVDTTSVDYVASCISIGNGASNCGISDPPTGWTTAAISQDDSGDGAGACAYRVNTTAPTDQVVWAATSWLPTAPAIIASFKGTAASAPAIYPPRLDRNGFPLKGPLSGNVFRPRISAYIQGAGNYLVSISESSAASDALATAAAEVASVNDAASASDSLGSNFAIASGIADPAAAADALSSAAADLSAISEAATASDNVSTGSSFSTTVSEAASAADTAVAVASVVGSVSDAAAATDSQSAGASVASSVTEVSTAADAIASALAAISLLAEAAAASDSVTYGAAQSASMTDSASASDSVVANAALISVLSEAASALETMSVALAAASAIGESGSATDLAQASAALAAAVSEAVAAIDGVAIGAAPMALSEAAAAADGLVAQASLNTAQSEAASAQDSVFPLLNGLLALAESVTATDALSFSRSGVVPILAASLRYVVRALRVPDYTIRPLYPPAFTIGNTDAVDDSDEYNFEDKFPAEKWPLTFDFTKRVPAGVLLTGIPNVTISVRSGYDPSAQSMFNGDPGFDSDTSPLKVIVPIMGGIPGTTYVIEVDCATTQGDFAPTIVGVLKVVKP